jgi:glucose-6-phosphate 1-dehydrogenase
MVQNHLLQVLALVAMEPPISLDAEAIRDEKMKLLNSIRILDASQVARHVVRGQYLAGEIDGQPRPAYRNEPKVSSVSEVETYVALKLFIDNWRWAGVPFFLRTGKSLPLNASEVRLQFRSPPYVLFAAQCGPRLDANALTLRLQPNEGISLRFSGKIPGLGLQLRPVQMRFSYDTEFGAYTPEAYERLLLDALAGDTALFIRSDVVETSWRIVDPIRAAWAEQPLQEQEYYPAGTWGPPAAEHLLAQTGHAWRNP